MAEFGGFGNLKARRRRNIFSSVSGGGGSSQATNLNINIAKARKQAQDLPAKAVPVSATDPISAIQRKTLQAATLSAGGKAIEKQIQKKADSELAFRETKALFKGLVAQSKGARGQQGGKLGPIPGAFGFLKEKAGFKDTGLIAAQAGQVIETALKQSRFLSGQNRLIKSVVEQLKQSLPGRLTTGEQGATRLRQSLLNAFRLLLAQRKSGISMDEFVSITDSDLTQIPNLRDFQLLDINILSTEEELFNIGMSQQEIKEFVDLSNNVFNTPALEQIDLPQEGDIFVDPFTRFLFDDSDQQAVANIPGAQILAQQDAQASPIPGSPGNALTADDLLKKLEQKSRSRNG